MAKLLWLLHFWACITHLGSPILVFRKNKKNKFPPEPPNSTEGRFYEAITKADVVGGLCQKRVDVTVCWVFLVFISFTPCKLCSVVRGDVSLSVCVCVSVQDVWRNSAHLSSLVPEEETWLPWTQAIIMGCKQFHPQAGWIWQSEHHWKANEIQTSELNIHCFNRSTRTRIMQVTVTMATGGPNVGCSSGLKLNLIGDNKSIHPVFLRFFTWCTTSLKL